MRTLSECRLGTEECVVLLNGKTFAENSVVVALGVTREDGARSRSWDACRPPWSWSSARTAANRLN
ncbi:protein of unknown function [Candidatus Nitrospira inopinata]|uniref:Uncharacterized protein n=1 Tax=Candidatus Nitrospira inopinata TaxID=1715989 RepID=A0A0S4KPB3_9BACT|nr:protein of unknown function [Candidatus Nitrospira inopinata]